MSTPHARTRAQTDQLRRERERIGQGTRVFSTIGRSLHLMLVGRPPPLSRAMAAAKGLDEKEYAAVTAAEAREVLTDGWDD